MHNYEAFVERGWLHFLLYLRLLWTLAQSYVMERGGLERTNPTSTEAALNIWLIYADLRLFPGIKMHVI